MQRIKETLQRQWHRPQRMIFLVLLLAGMGALLLFCFPWQALALGLLPTTPNGSIKDQATAAVHTFHREVANWGKDHQYHDPYNGKAYALDNSYMARGIGEDLDRELKAGDYQQTLADAQDELFQLHMLEQDATDTTAVDQVHATDKKLLDHYHLDHRQVLVIATIEQSLRLYENGTLIRGFLITAGSPSLPAVPGLWPSMQRLTHTTFHSPYPKGSPDWYPPTKINNAILYHEGGYFVHDAWWRANYGPNTQFPHPDASGNSSATVGTHGCINVPEEQMKWLFSRTNMNTMILIY